MKIRPVESELFHTDRRTDGRTDGRTEEQTAMTRLRVAFRNFPNTPKNLTHVSLLLESENLIFLLTVSVCQHYSNLVPYSFPPPKTITVTSVIFLRPFKIFIYCRSV